MFSVREVPWHGLGTIVEETLTAAEAIVAAGLDWDIQLLPSEYDFNGERHTYDGRFITARSDTGAALGSVGRNYVPLQNRDAFTFFDTLVDSGDAKYETAGSLATGKRVWMTAKLPEGVSVGGVDDVDVYLLLSNSHDGSAAVKAAVTPVRVVCQNTLNFAMAQARKAWSVRHVNGITAKMQEARESLELTFTYMDLWKDHAEALLSRKMSLTRFEVFSDKLVDELSMGDRLADDFRARTRALFAEGVTLENIGGTEWAAVNSVSEYFEHMRVDGRTTSDATLKRAWDPSNAAGRARQRAFALLTS